MRFLIPLVLCVFNTIPVSLPFRFFYDKTVFPQDKVSSLETLFVLKICLLALIVAITACYFLIYLGYSVDYVTFDRDLSLFKRKKRRLPQFPICMVSLVLSLFLFVNNPIYATVFYHNEIILFLTCVIKILLKLI